MGRQSSPTTTPLPATTTASAARAYRRGYGGRPSLGVGRATDQTDNESAPTRAVCVARALTPAGLSLAQAQATVAPAFYQAFGAASGRRAGERLPKHSLTTVALPADSRVVSAAWQPNVMAPTDGARPGPLASPRLLDSLFATTTREEPARAVSEVPPVRHAAASDGRWQPLLTEFDLLEQAIATLAWKEI